MPAQSICKACHQEYDPDTYGAGPSYCSVKCKHTRGGTYRIKEVGGRPRRWPRLTPAERELILTTLTSRGFLVIQPLMPTKFSKGGVEISRGYFTARLALGGGTKNCEKWADIVAYVNVHGGIVYTSACLRTEGKFDGPERHDGTRPILRKGPCGKDRCMRCTRYRWLRALTEMKD